MHIFKVRPEGFQEITERVIRMMVILFVAIMLLVLGVPVLLSDQPFQLGILHYMVLFFGGIFAFSIWSSLKKQKVLFESFTVTIDDEKIVRERLNTPTITILRKDVREIVKGSEGAFSIQGDSKLNPIGIPAQMKDYEALEKLLNEIKPLTIRTSKTVVEKFFIPLSLSGAVLMFTALATPNRLLGICCGIAFVGIAIACIVVIARSKNIDKQTKKMSYSILIPLVVVLINLLSRIGVW